MDDFNGHLRFSFPFIRAELLWEIIICNDENSLSKSLFMRLSVTEGQVLPNIGSSPKIE